jgi:hypothetical protein
MVHLPMHMKLLRWGFPKCKTRSDPSTTTLLRRGGWRTFVWLASHLNFRVPDPFVLSKGRYFVSALRRG